MEGFEGVERGTETIIDPVFWHRAVNRLVDDEGMESALAERVTGEAINFIEFVGKREGEAFSPSPLVDAGWHSLILYTREYAQLCDRLAGRFIHHSPNDIPGREARGYTPSDYGSHA